MSAGTTQRPPRLDERESTPAGRLQTVGAFSAALSVPVKPLFVLLQTVFVYLRDYA